VASCPPEWAARDHHLGSRPVRTGRRHILGSNPPRGPGTLSVNQTMEQDL
jgi:hypothetical protein